MIVAARAGRRSAERGDRLEAAWRQTGGSVETDWKRQKQIFLVTYPGGFTRRTPFFGSPLFITFLLMVPKGELIIPGVLIIRGRDYL